LNKYHVLCEVNGEQIKLVIRAKNEQQMIKECKKTKNLTKIISYKLLKGDIKPATKKQPPVLFGRDHPQAKLNEDVVKQIKQLLLQGEKCTHIARMFSVSDVSIRKIKDGKTWSQVVI
jgi:DNA invertase Pin-like site-specific DNA recombinase